MAESAELPIAQRTDVAVDERERRSLPHPAEPFDGRICYKMPNYPELLPGFELPLQDIFAGVEAAPASE